MEWFLRFDKSSFGNCYLTTKSLFSLTFSNGKTITPPFGRSLLPSAAHPLCGSQTAFVLPKKYFRSPAMQRFFKKN